MSYPSFIKLIEAAIFGKTAKLILRFYNMISDLHPVILAITVGTVFNTKTFTPYLPKFAGEKVTLAVFPILVYCAIV